VDGLMDDPTTWSPNHPHRLAPTPPEGDPAAADAPPAEPASP
jgi:hypothetical protein